MMKTELVQASDESERLMDKLHRLEEENKQLGEVASRLGGQDARLLKAEVMFVDGPLSPCFRIPRPIGMNTRVSKSN